MTETRNRLTPEEAWVILQKGTERPFYRGVRSAFRGGLLRMQAVRYPALPVTR